MNKADLRKQAFLQRKTAHENIAEAAGIAIIPHVLTLAKGYDAAAGYMPIRTEINILPAMRALIEAKKRVGVPVILKEAAPLEFHEWTPEAEMKAGAFGAAIPSNKTIITPDIIFAPLVAFDKKGTRLGYGGGFYDRTLEKLRKQKPVTLIGVAYGAQEMSELPREATDFPLDAIVTETGCHWF